MSQLSFNAFSGLGAGSMGLTYPELIAMQAAYGKQGLTHADMAATAAQVMAAQAPAAVPPPVAAAPTAAAVLAPVATSIAPQPSGGPAPWGSQDPKSWLRGKDLPGRRGGGRRRGRGFGRKRHRGGRNRHEIRDRHKQAAAYMAQQCQSQLAAVKQAKQALRSCKQNARSGSMSGLGLSFSPENRDKTAAYLIGAGTVGVLAGFGLGSKLNPAGSVVRHIRCRLKFVLSGVTLWQFVGW